MKSLLLAGALFLGTLTLTTQTAKADFLEYLGECAAYGLGGAALGQVHGNLNHSSSRKKQQYRQNGAAAGCITGVIAKSVRDSNDEERRRRRSRIVEYEHGKTYIYPGSRSTRVEIRTTTKRGSVSESDFSCLYSHDGDC